MSTGVALHGFGGGNAAFNFKIVPYDTEEILLAAKPPENTIGVVTGKIRGYVFSAAEPADPVEGLLWITVGIYSSVEFNALKKNCIQIYPGSAKQYTGNKWQDVIAMSYQRGAWRRWATYVYRAGDLCEPVTGGWIAYKKGAESGLGNSVMPSVTYNPDSIIVLCEGNSYPSGMWCTSNKINMSAKNKLVFDGMVNAHKAFLCVWSEIGTYCMDGLVAEVRIENTARGTTNLDISALSGSYYVGFRFTGNNAHPQMTMYGLSAE